MKLKSLIYLSMIVLFCATQEAHAQLVAWGNPRVNEVSREIQALIGEVNRAIDEISAEDDNLAEICFRVGNLYQTTRHELEEAMEQEGLSMEPMKLATALIRDARSLPSFCGDIEKTESDPGYEQVEEGDVEGLSRELSNMSGRARKLESLVSGRAS